VRDQLAGRGFGGVCAVEDERAGDAGVDRADPARDGDRLCELADQLAHRDHGEREVLAYGVELRPERADRAEQVDPGAEHAPAAPAQDLDRAGDTGRDHV
jgi:hypothetical protein